MNNEVAKLSPPWHGTEKIWATPSGLLAVVIMTDRGHRCGYVGVPKGHPLHGVGYGTETYALKPVAEGTSVGQRGPITLMGIALKGYIPRSPEAVFDVHGGITYAGKLEKSYVKVSIDDEALWWFGFDCAHYMDEVSPEMRAYREQQYPGVFHFGREGVHRSLEFCTDQCNDLAEQITTQTRNRFVTWLIRTWAAMRGKGLNQASEA